MFHLLQASINRNEIFLFDAIEYVPSGGLLVLQTTFCAISAFFNLFTCAKEEKKKSPVSTEEFDVRFENENV